MPFRLKNIYRGTIILLLLLIITAIIVYRILIEDAKIPVDAEGKETDALSDEEKQRRTWIQFLINTVYSVLILIFGLLYKMLAVKQTEAENWRYNMQYTNQLVDRLFRFNLFNFYFPMILVGFDQRNSQRLFDVFNIMLAQMAFKQISVNLLEYFKPLVLWKKSLEAHNQEYADLLKLYDDSKEENMVMRK